MCYLIVRMYMSMALLLPFQCDYPLDRGREARLKMFAHINDTFLMMCQDNEHREMLKIDIDWNVEI